MPMIRYNIMDIARYSDERCPCGRRLSVMESLEGRDSDIVITPGGDMLVVHFFTRLFEFIDGVNQFQVVQERVNRLQIKIVKNPGFREEDEDRIRHEILSRMGGETELIIDYVDDIPVSGRSGKRRFVISKVPLRF
jgi:phenylacetate-CoA ligase